MSDQLTCAICREPIAANQWCMWFTDSDQSGAEPGPVRFVHYTCAQEDDDE